MTVDFIDAQIVDEVGAMRDLNKVKLVDATHILNSYFHLCSELQNKVATTAYAMKQ